jgi:SAM-dependent methyltransferase
VTLVGTLNEQTRTAWVIKALQQLSPGDRLLDAGAGEQQYRKYCAHLNYVSQDFAKYNPCNSPVGLQVDNWNYGHLDIICDITAIPERDESFDAILCTEVLEHVPNPILAITEFARLLRTGGTLIVTAPFCSLTHFAPYHFVTGFNRYFYDRHLVDQGLELIELTPNGSYFEYLAQELRRLPGVSRRYSKHGLGRIARWALWYLLRRLAQFIGDDSGSSELLCFGYHVRAVKTKPGA